MPRPSQLTRDNNLPRDIPIGNGQILINFDAKYQMRDFHFPQVGGENHSAGHPFRFGVWVDGSFSWLSGDDWERSLHYLEDSLVTEVVLRNRNLRIEITCNDCVDFHENIYVKHIRLTNNAPSPRNFRLFFAQDFHISGFDLGDTASYYPQMNAIVHYKGMRYFLINALKEDGTGIDDYATGFKEMPGREGTWLDAEDGVLGKGPISQGSVDSVVGVHLILDAGATSELYYWICAGTSYQEVAKADRLIREKSPSALMNRTSAYWRLWTNKDGYDFADLPESIVQLYKRSLLILRTQIDNGGAIIAANDTDITQFNRDTYSYMWPRDGALVANALDLSGHNALSLAFFEFCLPLVTKEGYFLHKYNPDGSVGSSWHPWVSEGHDQLPIQEDESALIIWALWKHFDLYRDVDSIKPFYRDLIIRVANFLLIYIDEKTGLPGESYDLWEERRGIHSWTVGSVYGGLTAAANFADAFGETWEAERFRSAAQKILAATDTLMYREDLGRFVRMLSYDEEGVMSADTNIDSSIAGLIFFGMYDSHDPRIVSTMQQIYDRLWIKTGVGGLARYENDYYHQVSHDIGNVAGNPWFICTLWIAQYFIESANNEEELNRSLPIMEWVVQHSLPSGVLAEQVDPYSDAPLSVSPLTWSHASFVTTVVEYLDKKSKLFTCPECGQSLFNREASKLRLIRDHKQMSQTVIIN